MGQEPENERVVGVFRDAHAADEAAAVARAAGAEEVHVGASEDEVAAVRSEMREEAAEASPGFSTPEMARSVLFWTVIAALVGAAVAVPVGIIDTGNLPMATRLLIVALVGAAIGGTIGFFFAATTGVGFFGRHRTGHSDLAAERGVAVGAEESTGKVAPTLADQDSIRVDRVAPSGQPKDTVAKEGRRRRRR